VIKSAKDDKDLYTCVAIFALASIPLVLWFVSGIYVRVRRLMSNTAPGLVLAGGTGFALLFFVAFEIFAAPFTDFPGKADRQQPRMRFSPSTTSAG
jgi:hypothetical protein